MGPSWAFRFSSRQLGLELLIGNPKTLPETNAQVAGLRIGCCKHSGQSFCFQFYDVIGVRETPSSCKSCSLVSSSQSLDR